MLLTTITDSLGAISSFSVLLFLLIYIYILLGMEIFADQIKEPGGDQIVVNRTNFNTFLSSFIVIFTVLTGENWDQTMFLFAKKHGSIAILFFVSLVIIGVWIFLNLFLAILLDNFDNMDERKEDQENNTSIPGDDQSNVGNMSMLEKVKGWGAKIVQFFNFTSGEMTNNNE